MSDQKTDTTVADAALAFLYANRGPGGLGAAGCEALEQMLCTASDEGRILSKASRATAAGLAQAKAALLRCRAPEGDAEAAAERLRVIGMLEDYAQGLADTDAQRLRWLAEAAVKLRAPHAKKPTRPGGGPLPFRPPTGKR